MTQRVERAALDSRLYRDLFHSFDQGFCVFEVLFDENGTAVDYRFLEVNEPFERLTGLSDAVGRTALELVPNLERHWIDIYGRVAMTGKPARFEQVSEAMGRWFDVYAARVGDPRQRLVALVFNDITTAASRPSASAFSKPCARASIASASLPTLLLPCSG